MISSSPRPSPPWDGGEGENKELIATSNRTRRQKQAGWRANFRECCFTRTVRSLPFTDGWNNTMHSLTVYSPGGHLRWPRRCFCLLPCLAGGAESKTANKIRLVGLQASHAPAVPQSAIGNQQLVINNPIDAFIRARLAEKNLQPSPEADPVTLIRRITFDLTACRHAGGGRWVREIGNRQSAIGIRADGGPPAGVTAHGERWRATGSMSSTSARRTATTRTSCA